MIRRRPIPRSAYRWQPRPKKVNVLRYELILGGAIRVYPGKREVCQDNASGRRIYADRVREMVQRQDYRCSLCGGTLCAALATFEHTRRRGMHAAFRDDRITDEAGNWMNSAAHWECNSRKG
jgi:hypothetical protein